MMMRMMAAQMPALSLPEAAMLPALTPGMPRNLLLPQNGLVFQPVQPGYGGLLVDNVQRGTMAGRAALNHAANAPARRQRRCSHRAKSCVT